MKDGSFRSESHVIYVVANFITNRCQYVFCTQRLSQPNHEIGHQVIAAALAARADFIVSGDADLLSLSSFESIAIVTPAEAVARIEARGRV